MHIRAGHPHVHAIDQPGVASDVDDIMSNDTNIDDLLLPIDRNSAVQALNMRETGIRSG
jgi:hypothetical protein